MVIYGEYLFIENFLTGTLLLYLTAKLTGGRISRLRLAAAGVVCGAGGFTIFISSAGPMILVIRACIAFGAAAICFGIEGVIKRTTIFVSLTFLSGGATMALLLWQQIPAVSGHGALYIQPFTYGKLFMWGVIAFLLTWHFIKIVKERRKAVGIRGEVCLSVNGQQYLMEALADSGNSLKEPFTGKAVSLISKSAAGRLYADIPPERFLMIPYHAVGTKRGLLRGFRTDKIEFGGKTHKGAVVAFYEGDFEGFDVLLSGEVLNEEII